MSSVYANAEGIKELKRSLIEKLRNKALKTTSCGTPLVSINICDGRLIKSIIVS